MTDQATEEQAEEQTYYDETVKQQGYDPLAHMHVSRDEFLSVFMADQKQPEWLHAVLQGHPAAVSEPIEWEDEDDDEVTVVQGVRVEDDEDTQECEYPECDFECVGDDAMLDHLESAHPTEEDEE